MREKERRSGKERRSKTDRRRAKNPYYKGTDRRYRLDRRSGKERRKSK